MIGIYKAPTGVTNCSLCGGNIPLHATRIDIWGTGWGTDYLCKECAKKYFEAILISLMNDKDPGYLGLKNVNQILIDNGVIVQ